MDNPKMYRITSPLDLYVPFTKGLLTTEQLKKWEEYKKEEVKGRTEDEIKMLHAEVESVRLRKWATTMGFGADPIQNEIRKGGSPKIPPNYIPENKFLLPEGESKVSETIMKELARFKKKEIKQKLQPGETRAKINVEGFLEIEEMAEEEVEDLKNKKK